MAPGGSPAAPRGARYRHASRSAVHHGEDPRAFAGANSRGGASTVAVPARTISTTLEELRREQGRFMPDADAFVVRAELIVNTLALAKSEVSVTTRS